MWNVDTPETLYFSAENTRYTTENGSFYDLDAIVRCVEEAETIALDTETTGLNKVKCVPLYWSLAFDEVRMTMHADILPLFDNAFRDPNKNWLFANAKFDVHMLSNVGIHLAGKWSDVQVMHALLYEDRPHRLKYIAEHILGWTWADFETQFGKIGKKQSAEDVIRKAENEDFDLLKEYAANDAWGTLLVYRELKRQLEGSFTHSLFSDKPPYINTLWDFFREVERPFTKVLWKMERRGIKVNRKTLEDAEPAAAAEIKQVEKDFVKLVGRPINIRSTPQLCEYFITDQKLEPLKMTGGGKSGDRKPSIDTNFLEHYKDRHQGALLVTRHRELSKLHGTYIVGLSSLMDGADRIHTSFNQDVARTGRLSSSEPNIQNIPRPENDKWNLRGAFITEPGWKVMAADYAQLEMRLLAAAAMEQPMIDIFLRGWDIHCGNAALMFNTPYEDIIGAKKLSKMVDDPDILEQFEAISPGVSERMEVSVAEYIKDCVFYRSAAKNIGFGLNYGMGSAKLANSLKCSREDAQDKINVYKETYPAVSRFFEEAVNEGRNYGYAFTVMGRRRNIPMILSNRRDERALGERLAVNTAIQGSAADVTRMAQINIDHMNWNRTHDVHMLLQVHDELVFEGPEDAVNELKSEVEVLMAHPFSVNLACPMEAEAGIGGSWGEAK